MKLTWGGSIKKPYIQTFIIKDEHTHMRRLGTTWNSFTLYVRTIYTLFPLLFSFLPNVPTSLYKNNLPFLSFSLSPELHVSLQIPLIPIVHIFICLSVSYTLIHILQYRLCICFEAWPVLSSSSSLSNGLRHSVTNEINEYVLLNKEHCFFSQLK